MKKIQTKNGLPIIMGNLVFGGKKPYKGTVDTNKQVRPENSYGFQNSEKEFQKKHPGLTGVKIVKKANRELPVENVEKPERKERPEKNESKLFAAANKVLVSEDLIATIRSGTYTDLFKPINTSGKLQNFQNHLINVFKIKEYKIKGYTLMVLKIVAYLKQLKSSGRKFLPEQNDLDEILAAAMLYDIAYTENKNVHNVIHTLEDTQTKDYNIEALVDKLSTLVNRVEYYQIDNNLSDDLDHYDPKIKFLRILKEPKLNNLLDEVLVELTEIKFKVGYVGSDFDRGIYYLNSVKKLGLKYINSRSNFEWFCYNKSLRKIRNFLSRDKYFVFLKVIEERIDAFKEREEIHSFLEGDSLYYLENTLKKMISQRAKKQC